MRKRRRRTGFGLALLLVFLLADCGGTKRFDIVDGADFYILGYDGVTGYRMDNGQPVPVAQTEMKLVKKSVNPLVHRAEFHERYVVFFDEAGRVVSVDFHEGKVRFQKTKHGAWTTAGSSNDNYFAYTNGVAVFTPELKETDYVKLEPSVLVNDFQVADDPFFMTGSDLQESVDEFGNRVFQNRLLQGSVQDGKLTIENRGALENGSYWFGDTLGQGDVFYCVCLGWRDPATRQKVMEGSMFRYDVGQGTGEFFPIGESGPLDLYDVGENRLAITHMFRFGFTLFDQTTGTSSFVELEEQEEERIMDIQRLDADRLLILSETRLLAYNLNTGAIDFAMPCDSKTGTAFHVWVVK